MPPTLCFPAGLLNVKVMSGTPDTFDVKAMLPFANAASGLPDGARVTESVSMISAYISLEVWRTFERLQGSAGVFAEEIAVLEELARLGFELVVL